MNRDVKYSSHPDMTNVRSQIRMIETVLQENEDRLEEAAKE